MVQFGDRVRHRSSGKTGVVKEVMLLLPTGVTVLFVDEATGIPTRALESEIDIIETAPES